MTRSLYIVGSRRPRPAAERVIYCDGGTDDSYREGIDLELSHWIPNRTPDEFKAGTSTQICMKFVAGTGRDDPYDLVVNNHVDVDGVLSAYALLFPASALAHQHTLEQAADMGDFWGWGDPEARELFQALALLMRRFAESKTDPQVVYERCFDCTHAMLSGERWADCAPGLSALESADARISKGEIERAVTGHYFVHYALPRSLAETDLEAALHVPRFNAPISRRAILPPHARARRDGERVQLVSVEAEGGWYYDLWYPGYTWADTVGRWRPPGVRPAGSSNAHQFLHPPLRAGVDALADREKGAHGRWTLAGMLSPFASLEGRNFSVVLSFLADGAPAPSSLPPAKVVPILAKAFEPA